MDWQLDAISLTGKFLAGLGASWIGLCLFTQLVIPTFLQRHICFLVPIKKSQDDQIY